MDNESEIWVGKIDILTHESGLEKYFGASEPFVIDFDHSPIWEFIGTFQRLSFSRSLQFCLEIKSCVTQLFFDVSGDIFLRYKETVVRQRIDMQ